MEWSGRQQIEFLLQSFLLGVVQGLLLDVMTGLVFIAKRKRWLWTDMIFGPIAAIITFCGALVIMDGQLHPLLFFGVFFGMALEHVVIGTYVCRLMRHLRRGSMQIVRMIQRFLRRFLSVTCVWAVRLVHYREKPAENDEKT